MEMQDETRAPSAGGKIILDIGSQDQLLTQPSEKYSQSSLYFLFPFP